MRVPAVWVFLTVVVLAGAVVPAAAADLSLQYNVDRRVFRVCNLLLPGATNYTNYTPFFFIALDHSALKPAGWEFDNPLASPRVTPAMANLWTDAAHSPVGGSGGTYWTDRGMAIGSPINKSWPQHWEVVFNAANAGRLRDFDLIHVSAASIGFATGAERATLMNIVRDGATLWIDSGATVYTTAVGNFAPPLLNPVGSPFTFTSVASSTNFYRGVTDPNNLSDLFISPLRITPGEVRYLGRYPDGATPCDGSFIMPGAGTLDQALQPILSTWNSSASPATATTAVSVCEYGAGRIIVSACGIGMDVEDWFIAGSRTPNRYQAPDVKFAYNALAWGTQWDAGRQASTNTGYTTTSALPPLDLVWQWPAAVGPASNLIGPILASPVLSHGRLYAISLISMVPAGGGAATPAMLLCFDAGASTAPGAGPSYNLLWSASLNSLINTACGANVTDATPHWAGLSAVDMPNGVPAVLFSAVRRAGSGNGYVVAVNAATGAAMSGYTATPYPGGAGPAPSVRDISTPVVHNGWVYFLTSEFNNSLDGDPANASPDDTYGRAYCIDLATFGTTAGWVYPNPVLGEWPKLLPPFAEPSWVAAVAGWNDGAGAPRQVPFDAPMVPIVTPHSRNANDVYTDAVLTVGSPVSLMFSGGMIQLNRASPLPIAFDPAGITNARRGGLDFALIPSPAGLNGSYFHFYVQNPIKGGSTVTVARADDMANIYTTAVLQDPDATNGIVLSAATAHQLLSHVSSVAGGIANPLALPGGVRLTVIYTPTGATATTQESAMLPGVEPWSVQYADCERRCTNAAVRGDRLFATTNTPDVGSPAGSTAHVIMQDLRDSQRDARFSPMAETPAAFGATQARSEAAPAVGHGTAAASSVVFGAPVGGATPLMPTLSALATDLNLRVSLGTYPRAAALPQAPAPYGLSRGFPPTITLLGGGVIDPSQYQLGLADASVTFNWEAAPNILTVGGASAGPIYGQPILASWTSDNGTPDNPADDVTLGPELYVVPPLGRFNETSAWLSPSATPGVSNVNGVIKLQHYPVELTSVAIATADGMPVVGWTAAEGTLAYTDNTTSPSTAYPSLLPHGWINLTSAKLDLNGNGTADATEPSVPIGITLLVSYRGFSNDFGFFNVGSPLGGYVNPPWAPAFPREHVQAPILFGGSASAVAMAGSAIHIGTEGYAYRDTSSPADGFQDFEAPGGDINDTFLSFQWDPASNFVRAFTCPVANRGIFGPAGAIVAATGMPAPTANGLFTGGRVMSNASLGLEIGFLSKLRTRETVIVDAGRVLRCVGQDPASELTGTQSFERGQSATDRPTPLPFNHPSKVTVLQNGNLLIVDTGNNRVVETDSAGNVLWPLDNAGFNYYSSGANSNLHLLRPTDAERYYTSYDINGDGTIEDVTNTVIADGGNSRVIHVRSWWSWSAAAGSWIQNHQVQVVTPEFLRDPANPARRVRAHYTQVELLTNPTSGALIGYLLAAPNLNQIIVRGFVGTLLVTNPPAAVPIPGAGNYTWALWSWLYNPPGPTVVNNPLSFLGIRNISLRHVDNSVYLDVSALQYQGQYTAFAANGVPFYQTIGAAVDPGAGVFEWAVNYDPNGTPGLVHATPSGTDNYACPIWRFTQVEYAAIPYFNIALPGGGTYTKRFVPTSASMLPSGRHLISNYTGVVERFTKAALNATGVVTSSEVFEVATNTGGDTNPANDTFVVDYRRVMPDPYGPDWPDPLIAPVYAERVMY